MLLIIVIIGNVRFIILKVCQEQTRSQLIIENEDLRSALQTVTLERDQLRAQLKLARQQNEKQGNFPLFLPK